MTKQTDQRPLSVVSRGMNGNQPDCKLEDGSSKLALPIDIGGGDSSSMPCCSQVFAHPTGLQAELSAAIALTLQMH